MTDVLLRQSNDGGEIAHESGLVLMSEGLETSAYLSLFGGNRDDAGDDATEHLQWWGNLDEVETSRMYRSETGNLIESIAAVPHNLKRIEQAAGRDLAWMVERGVAKSVTAAATIPGPKHVRLTITIDTLAGRVVLVFG